MIMKKFYIPILAVVFLLGSFLSQAQITYNSISNGNPSNFTLDDARFWVGAQPPNPCTDCIINICSNVTMVQNGASSDPTHNCAFCTFLNDVVINTALMTNSTLNLYGNTTLTINTYRTAF